MALSIDFVNKIITVPQSYLSSLGGGIYELDTETMHDDLRAFEDDVEGIVHSFTHNHYAPLTVGGVTLSRVVELTNGYTVTFEDGQYAVNLVGSNNNISDQANVNQVSIRAGNSAGLIQVTSGSGVIASDITDIKNAVWNATASDYTTADTTGKTLTDGADSAELASIK